MKQVTVNEAYAAWQAGDVAIVDIREEREYDVTRVPGVPLIPMTELQARLEDLPGDRPLVIMCRSGNRSATVTDFLTDIGDWGEVANLEGGIIAWAANGLPYEGDPPQ